MQSEIVSQYRAALTMLISVIDKCPDKLWGNVNYTNPYWQIVYHTLHYTNFYLSKDEASFAGWPKHRPGIHQLGTAAELTAIPYSKEDLTGYATDIGSSIDAKLHVSDMTAPSGFEWLPMNKFELHLYNIRHLQHHTGQLVERLHNAGISGITWVGVGR